MMLRKTSIAVAALAMTLSMGASAPAQSGGEDSRGLWQINVDRKSKGGRDKLRVKSQSRTADDKGVAWVSGSGGVRGYSKAGKAAIKLKVRRGSKSKGGTNLGEWIADVERPD